MSNLITTLLTFGVALAGDGALPNIAGNWRIMVGRAEFELALVQKGSGLSGTMKVSKGTEPPDHVLGMIRPDGTLYFMRAKAKQRFDGKVALDKKGRPDQLAGTSGDGIAWFSFRR
jgi:hypothetical protein